ncbi:serine hydrolase domain-containing protein [Paenibacillus sp. MBLB4367]|uniref:serine hydrolase domain-containing protein n=1 Tax=Paenibacillus sp. MBLB4367 TaxID=3384767 RepID=UPI0039083615
MRLPHTVESLIDTFKNEPLRFEPGARQAYTNSEYVLLARIIGFVTGIPYERYIQEQLLDKIGLSDTGFDDGLQPIRRAQGYHLDKRFVHAPHVDMSVAYGGWSMYSTVGDLYRWDRALKENGRLLGQHALESMFTPYFPRYGGYGWDVSDISIGGQTRRRIAHFGDIAGFVNYFCRFDAEDLTIIALSNTDMMPVEAFCTDIAKILFGEEAPPVHRPQPSKAAVRAESYAGTYEIEKGSSILIKEENGLLYVSPDKYDNWFTYPLRLHSDRIRNQPAFVAGHVNDKVVFDVGDDGMADKLTYYDASGGVFEAYRKV